MTNTHNGLLTIGSEHALTKIVVFYRDEGEQQRYVEYHPGTLAQLVEQVEAAEGQSGIYRDALQRIAEGSWAIGSPKYTDQPRKFAKDVLRAQDSTPAMRQEGE